jgi:hypothetical protein
MRKIFLFIFFLLGIVFRYLIIYFHPEPFIYDQTQYHIYALSILKNGLYAEPARLPGYPLLLAVIYKIFGDQNHIYWQMSNIFMDVSVALLLYFMGNLLFKTKFVSWIIYIFYLFNPYTSAYTGVALSEILTIFFTVLVYYLTLQFIYKKKNIYIFLTALVSGYLSQLKPSFFIFSIVYLSLIIYITSRQNIKTRMNSLRNIISLLILFFIPFGYTVAGNYAYFHSFRLSTVDNLFFREFYMSQYLDRPPMHVQPGYVWPKEVQAVFDEYTVVPKNNKERNEIALKYFGLAWKNILNNPSGYFIHYIRKVIYIWEKHTYFCFIPETTNPEIINVIYISNIIFLALSLFGLVISVYQAYINRDIVNLNFFFLIIFLLVYLSLEHMFSTGEERFTLPAYPLLYIFGSYSICLVINRIKSIFKRKQLT